MKRRFLLLMMTALLSVGAWAESLWTGEATPNGWGFVLTESKSMSVGDILTFTITAEPSWGGITLKTVKEATNPETGGTYPAPDADIKTISAKMGKVVCVVDAAIAAAAADGLWLGGGDYTVTSVDYEKKPARYNVFTNSSGESVTYNDHELSKDKLVGVRKGDMLEINITGTSEEDGWGANINIYSPAQWQGGTQLFHTSVSYGASTLKIVLTDELVSAAHANGLFLNGGNYTYTSVDIVYAPTVNISSAGYATLGFDESLDLTGIDAYTVTVSGDKAQLTSVKGKKIPAGTGIILKGSGNVTIPLTTETPAEITGNELLVSDGTVTGNESGTIYVLANGKSGVGFYPVENGSAITAGKAYLSVPAGARQFIGFGDDNETTGIQTVANSQQSAANSYYDLQGRRVAQPAKGLYIVNGKKVIIK